MASEADAPEAHFPLNMVTAGLEGFDPPRGAFDPTRDWELAYAVCTLTRKCDRVGELRLRREARGRRRFTLGVTYNKAFPGGSRQVVTGELECRTDSLSTPLRWRYVSETRGADGRPLGVTRIEKTAKVKRARATFDDGGGVRSVALPDAYTVNWCLFEAVQRLPRDPFAPLRFTMLDHFDQPKPNQTLSFRKSVDVMLGVRRVQRHRYEGLEKGRIRKTFWAREGGRAVRLHAYDHVGDGIVPWVYWVDDGGRLLFAVAGLEAYLLEPPASA